MAIGDPPDEPPRGITILNWDELYAREDGDHAQAIIPNVAYRGRWTAIAAFAKQGKSTLLIGLVYQACQAGHTVLYVDAEMGRTDMLDRVEAWMHLEPHHLTNLHYTDLPPKLDNHEGANMLHATVEELKPDLVVIDGLNGVIYGGENDDTPWRDLFELTIQPLKALNVAVVTCDNTGHTDKKRPRGHSVKVDKADAIIALERTDDGVKLSCELRRTSAYPTEQCYIVEHASEEGPPMTIRTVEAGEPGGAPTGTANVIAKLDALGADNEISVRQAEKLLRSSGHGKARGAVAAACKTRRNRVTELFGVTSTKPQRNPVTENQGVYVVTLAQTSNEFEPNGNTSGDDLEAAGF
jgi:KaiC/GvpD/RAD55 family RecA-like ATPase